VRFVDVAVHSPGDDPKPGTLASMIRQSGLPKSFFGGGDRMPAFLSRSTVAKEPDEGEEPAGGSG